MRESFARGEISAIRKGLQRGGQKLVAVDARGDALAASLRFNAEHAPVATDVHVTRERDLLRQREDKLDRAARLRRGLAEKIKTAIADVARFAVSFSEAGAIG